MNNIRKAIIILITIFTIGTATSQNKWVVNFVVSGLKNQDLTRYKQNYVPNGFQFFFRMGTTFTECYYDYYPTLTTSGLHTLATGTEPSMHGVCTSAWYSRIDGNKVNLCAKSDTQRQNTMDGIENIYTSEHFHAQTLQDIICSLKNGKAVSIATDCTSAMAMAGRSGECYWISDNGSWASCSSYCRTLPEWVISHNNINLNRLFSTGAWFAKYSAPNYENRNVRDVVMTGNAPKTDGEKAWLNNIRNTPKGNTVVLEFAKRAIKEMSTDKTRGIRLINICLDAPRLILEKYGNESVEYEDMLYQLDAALENFLAGIKEFTKDDAAIFTLTSDHGSSPMRRKETETFSPAKAKVILNAFLSARHGQEQWVLGVHDGGIYLNHEIIYSRHLNLQEIQSEVATFFLQMRGISTTFTAHGLQNSSYNRGLGQYVQNGFNSQHSGDVIYVLMPNIGTEENAEKVSFSGSPYTYDRHVPLYIAGTGVVRSTVDRRVSPLSLAPTIADMLKIERPAMCDAESFTEITK